MTIFTKYHRTQIAEMKPWQPGENMERVSNPRARQGSRLAETRRHDRAQPEKP